MATGLWFDANLSILVVCAECVLEVVLLALAFFVGLRAGKQQTSWRIHSNGSKLLPLEGEISDYEGALNIHTSTSMDEAKTLYTMRHLLASSSMVAEPDQTESVRLSPDFLNRNLIIAWPLISEFAETILHDKIQPELQKAMPSGMGTIHFDKNINMGRSPPVFKNDVKLYPVVTDNIFNTGETNNNLRMKLHLDYRGDCQIFLNSNVATHFLSKVTSTIAHLMGSHAPQLSEIRVGVEDVHVEGTVVVEFAHLLPRPPFAGGIRAYFANPPKIDFSIQGDLSGVLNTSFIKQEIIHECEGQVGQLMVLPNVIAIPMDRQMNYFAFKSPPPDGILRCAVLEVRGLQKPSDSFVSIVLGTSRCRTPTMFADQNPTWSNDNVFEILVSDIFSQNMHIAVLSEEGSALWGRWEGESFGGCAVRMRTLTKEAKTRDWTCWLCMSEVGHETPNGWGLLKSFSSEPHDGLCVKIQIEWRTLTKDLEQAKHLHMGKSIQDDWTLRRSGLGPYSYGDVTCIVIVCIGGFHTKHFATDPAPIFRCTVMKSASRGHTETTDERTTKDKRQINLNGQNCVIWNQTFYFSVVQPNETSITISVKASTTGDFEDIGHAEYGLDDLLCQPHLNMTAPSQKNTPDFTIKLFTVGPPGGLPDKSMKFQRSGSDGSK